VSNPRAELGQRIADAIKAKGGVVVSVVPPRAHEQVTFETRTAELGANIAEMLRERGLHVNSLGTTERLVHNATVEEIEYEIERGGKAKRTVDHPGLARFHTFEVVLPSDASMREIPGKPPPRPVKPPPRARFSISW
jgi:hypothetical protein